MKSGVKCDVTHTTAAVTVTSLAHSTPISFHRSGMKADITRSHGREGEKDTEKAHKVRSQKGHCTAGISTVAWYGRQAGGYRQDVGFLGNNKVWNPPEDYLKMDYMTGMCKMA